ncbi:MAG: M20 family metallopeptidase [Actinomycetales bacterium]|nr:M20 family metallopeptidase [Actinomycetales bacterium]
MAETVTAGASADQASVVTLLRRLVRAPSRGGLDDYAPVVDVVTSWLREAGLSPRVLTGPDGPVAVVCDVAGASPGPRYVLDACLDTAGYGDVSAWTHDPVSAEVDDEGWMYGRGTSDSKVAVAIFCHIAARLAAAPETFGGTVTTLFDLDEHTGGFAGIRSYLDEVDTTDLAGVFIGYPGPDTVVIGGRGFLRARITVFGQADHSASRKLKVSNAAVKAARLVAALDDHALARREPGPFGVPPKLTVTSINGGASGAFSVVPDRCEVEVDIRLTPDFDADAARTLLRRTLAEVDKAAPAPRRSTIEQVAEPWPPFKLAHDHPLPKALLEAARSCGFDPIPVVAGPSNIGNLLAGRGIPATAGFGVRYRALHATDEAIDLATIPAVQATYHRALLSLLARRGE